MNVRELNSKKWAVIDLDTGTVLGTNLALVELPEDEERVESILSSDSEAFAYAAEHGIPLRADVED